MKDNPCVICEALKARHLYYAEALTRLDSLGLLTMSDYRTKDFVMDHRYLSWRYLQAKDAIHKHICYRRTQWFR